MFNGSMEEAAFDLECGLLAGKNWDSLVDALSTLEKTTKAFHQGRTFTSRLSTAISAHRQVGEHHPDRGISVYKLEMKLAE